MKTALYHQEGKAPMAFAVLKEHEDGTIDIGPAGGAPVVTRCVVVEDGKPGFATLASATKPATDPLESKKVDELREIAGELGIEFQGLKKDDLVAAIKAKQSAE